MESRLCLSAQAVNGTTMKIERQREVTKLRWRGVWSQITWNRNERGPLPFIPTTCPINVIINVYDLEYTQYMLCTGGAYYVTYIFRFISNKFWNWGGGEGGLHLKGHGNEADFLGFLEKSVRHRFLTLHFEPFQFGLRIHGDIRNRTTTPRVGESTKMPIDTIFFIHLNNSMVLVHYIPGFFYVKLIF
jgi:hypothetical protein